MDSLTPGDLFSPSKARQQRAQAQDWAQIESWLNYKYAGRSIPSFERNEETLKALRTLSMENERVDEERAVIEQLERDSLKELEETPHNPANITLQSHLTNPMTHTGTTALHALAATSVILDVPSPSPETIAQALITHTITTQTLNQQLHQLQSLHSYLETQLSSLRTEIQTLKRPEYTTPPSLPRQTTDWTRQTKQLRSKLREYEDRLSALSSTPQSAREKKRDEIASAEGLRNLRARETEVGELRKKVEELEGEVGRYAGLPADKEAARKEVNALELELIGLRRGRDELFEGLVGGKD